MILQAVFILIILALNLRNCIDIEGFINLRKAALLAQAKSPEFITLALDFPMVLCYIFV